MGWLIALGAYTGCRQAELATLDRRDVVKHEGVACLHIRESKTEAGEDRLVPVHPDMIAAGFLDYVTRCHGRLFKVRTPDVPKRFAELRERCEVPADVKFHGLRKSFVRALENAGVDTDTIAAMVGHKRSFTTDVYNPDGPELRRLYECVALIRFDGLTLPVVRHAAD
jgi:integrase